MRTWYQKLTHFLQNFDATDKAGTSWDYTKPSKSGPREFGGRYGTTVGGDGLAVTGLVSETLAPIGGWFLIGGTGSRSQGQWAQAFPAKISYNTGGTLKAKVQKNSTTVATDLAETVVKTIDGSSPGIGTPGIIVVGSDLSGQDPIFLATGAAQRTFLTTVNEGSGLYTLQEYTYKGGSAIGSPIVHCEELNLTPGVAVGAGKTWVRGQLEGDGVIRFVHPVGCS